mmetsp:Transcript_58178/g.104120  ORF Transcript_58178/g.104120 Transcript_58178/m.104120 type:complete len:1085 (+) Transcript_58178:48-3302(+)
MAVLNKSLPMLVSVISLAALCSAHMSGRDLYGKNGLQLSKDELEHEGVESFSVHAGGHFSRSSKSKSDHASQADGASVNASAENANKAKDTDLSKQVDAGIKSLTEQAAANEMAAVMASLRAGAAAGARAGAIAGVKAGSATFSALEVYEHNGKAQKAAPPDASAGSAGSAGSDLSDLPSVNGKAPDSVCEAAIFARPDPCPDSCPLAAESASKDMYCHFKCVKPNECGTADTNNESTITDMEHHQCRRCNVEGCLHCVAGKPGEDIEECKVCMPGYFLTPEKECEGIGEWVFLVIAVVAVIIVIIALLWYFDLVNRNVVNEPGLKYALECRHRAKLRQPQDTEPGPDGIGPRLIYPFNTNMCSENVAGPGNMLFFRFQMAGLIWAVVLLGTWAAIGFFVSTDIFILGLKDASTPQLMCAVVKWGRHRQMQLIWTKVYWLGFAYVFSFLGAIWMAVNSHTLAQTLDNETDTMSDYVAICHDLPTFKGDVDAETLIKESVERETGEKVVGVSVCWNYHHHAEKVVTALEEEVGSIEASRASNNRRSRADRSSRAMGMLAAAEAEPHEEPGFMTGIMDNVNANVLGKWQIHTEEEHQHGHGEEAQEESIVHMLHELECSGCAFVVFETEDSRDKALEVSKEKPLPIEGGGFFLEEETHEPESCCWEDFHVTEAEIGGRLFAGTIKMLIALTGWTVLLYLPYAHYMGSFSYANGDKPGEMSEAIFVCLVVAAQIGLFVVAGQVAHHSGFCYEDDKQRIYILMYNAALILNLMLDMSLTAMLSYHQMVGRGVRTADGQLLGDLQSFQEIFESYPMQKSVGRSLFKYCWPATFFVPFAAEPIVANYAPYHIGRLFILTNKKLVGERAEKAMELPEQEQGRYADIIFNMILLCSVPFLAPGYILLTGGAMLFSHTYLYFYDHWKVLRGVARFYFASDVVYKFGQKLFCIPVGILAAAFVFKANQMSGDPNKLGSGYFKGYELGQAIAAAMFGHMILHCCVLDYLVPAMASVESKNTTATYAETATNLPCTWFSANPVHCLRSKYIKKDNPPQCFYVAGKEHLMKKNPKIGAYFEQGESDLGITEGEDLGF